jgi:hypothetical protein
MRGVSCFIDETAVTTKMIRQYGRSPRGERLVARVPHGHWKTLTLVAALGIDGLTAPHHIGVCYSASATASSSSASTDR